jgi:hypothetical protein
VSFLCITPYSKGSYAIAMIEAREIAIKRCSQAFFLWSDALYGKLIIFG